MPERRTQQRTILTSQETAEWYTPVWVIEAARLLLGGIDLDPASSALANEIVQAETFYSQADDGLVHAWNGRIWLNPPYNGDAALWSRRLVEEYRASRVTAACLLVYAKLGYDWFEDLWTHFPTCFFRKRISFVPPGGETGDAAKHGSALIYLGPDVGRFKGIFSVYGRVIFPEVGND